MPIPPFAIRPPEYHTLLHSLPVTWFDKALAPMEPPSGPPNPRPRLDINAPLRHASHVLAHQPTGAEDLGAPHGHEQPSSRSSCTRCLDSEEPGYLPAHRPLRNPPLPEHRRCEKHREDIFHLAISWYILLPFRPSYATPLFPCPWRAIDVSYALFASALIIP